MRPTRGGTAEAAPAAADEAPAVKRSLKDITNVKQAMSKAAPSRKASDVGPATAPPAEAGPARMTTRSRSGKKKGSGEEKSHPVPRNLDVDWAAATEAEAEPVAVSSKRKALEPLDNKEVEVTRRRVTTRAAARKVNGASFAGQPPRRFVLFESLWSCFLISSGVGLHEEAQSSPPLSVLLVAGGGEVETATEVDLTCGERLVSDRGESLGPRVYRSDSMRRQKSFGSKYNDCW